jgi:ubiquinone/menaquinone biosynthesis C-methylase UbiE
MKDEALLNQELKNVEKDFAEIVTKIPPRGEPYPLGPYWLHLEIIERYRILLTAHIDPGTAVLEVGCGPHVLATVPLAYMVDDGRVCAVDRGRWTYFNDVLEAAALRERVMPLWCDAGFLPLQPGYFNTAVIVHGIRSLHDGDTMVGIFREMLRVSPRIFVAESLPIARTRAQKAHLDLYNLREEVFELVEGRKDDINYLPLDKLAALVETAGGIITKKKAMEVHLPHYLAFFSKRSS